MKRASPAPVVAAFAVRCNVMRLPARPVHAFACLVVALAASIAAAAPRDEDAPPTGTRLQPLEIQFGRDDALYAAPTRLDRIGRIMAPVMVNGQGPFRFIVDTGASRTVLSPRLVEKLGLTLADEPLTIHGVTGAGSVPSVQIDELRAGDIVLRDRRLPVIEPHVFADADGILGVEGFEGMRIRVDFASDRIEITRPRRAVMGGDWVRVPVKFRFGRLMVVDARIGKIHVKAVIDTGAERTLGNLPLRAALDLDAATQEKGTERQVYGATATPETGNSLQSPELYLGKSGVRRMEVTYADLNVFHIWGLDQEPALVLGMDVIGTVRSIIFDYRRRELLLIP